MATDQEIRNFLRWNATVYDCDGWVYSDDLSDLVEVRYRNDLRGATGWLSRLGRAFNVRVILCRDEVSRALGMRFSWRGVWEHVVVSLRRERLIPDCRVGGNLVWWDEDGVCIAMMSPNVCVAVLDFIEAEPGNPHAVALMGELRGSYERNWGGKKA